MNHEDKDQTDQTHDSSEASEPPIRVRPKATGLAVEGDQFYVWEETSQEALRRGENLARAEQGQIEEKPGEAEPAD